MKKFDNIQYNQYHTIEKVGKQIMFMKIAAIIILILLSLIDFHINSSQLIFSLLLFCLSIVFGIIGIFKNKIMFIILSSIALLLMAFRPANNIIESKIELFAFSILFICFVELSHAIIRFPEIDKMVKEGAIAIDLNLALKKYLLFFPIFMSICFALIIFVFGINEILAQSSDQLSESLEMNSVYGVILATIIIFGAIFLVITFVHGTEDYIKIYRMIHSKIQNIKTKLLKREKNTTP